MVRSKIDNDISYPDSKEIDTVDNGTDAATFDFSIKGNDIIIALGKLHNDHQEQGILYVPIYLLVNDNIDDKIGVFEFLSSNYTSLLDEDGDLDIDSLDAPIFFNFVTDTYIKSKYKDFPITSNSNTNEDEENDEEENDEEENDEEESAEEEEDEEENNDDNKNTSNNNFTPGKSSTILKELEIEEDNDKDTNDDNNEKIEKSLNNKFVKSKGTPSSWIQNFMKINKYGIQDNEGGGDCFFCIIRDAFKSMGISITVKQLRERLSDSITQKMYDEYYKMYTEINDSIEHDRAVCLQMMNNWPTKKEKIETETDGKTRLALIAEAKKFKIEFEKIKRQMKLSKEMLIEYKWMNGLDSLSKFKSKVKTCSFWADSDSIVILEQLLKIKIIIFSSTRYRDGDMDSVLQCGDMVPKAVEDSGHFKPKYYILGEHTGNHYKLITYGDKKIFRFSTLPPGIKSLIKEKCMEKGKNIYTFIPKFKALLPPGIEEKKINDDDKTGSMAPGANLTSPSSSVGNNKPIYDENTIFQFYSKSSDKPLPGKGSGEKIDPKRIREFSDLASINGWRKILSNFYVEPFELDGNKWQSVEHFYHAQKFKKNNPEFYLKFSLDSNSEIAQDPVLAKAAGGKTGKFKGKLIRPRDIIMDEDFFSSGRNASEMERAQLAKYTQSSRAKSVLKSTKNAKLQHYVRGQKPIVFEDTMRIRQQIQ